MKPDYWQIQDAAKPLYGNLLWSRPENRRLAGKLLIIGGSEHGFAAPAAAYNLAMKNGAGTVRVALPDSLRRTVGRVFEAGEYVPSTPSGSFAQTALAELLSMALWADGVLLAGDLGRNSETAILLEGFISKYRGQLTIAGDAVDYLISLPVLLDRPETLIVPDFAQLQKLFVGGGSRIALTSKLDLLHVVEALHAFSEQHRSFILLPHDRVVAAVVASQVSTTRFSVYDMPPSDQLAAAGAVWWLQNPGKPLQALTTVAVAHLSST